MKKKEEEKRRSAFATTSPSRPANAENSRGEVMSLLASIGGFFFSGICLVRGVLGAAALCRKEPNRPEGLRVSL